MGCGNSASFTKRKIESTEVELIGSGDIYEPVCRECFFTEDITK